MTDSGDENGTKNGATPGSRPARPTTAPRLGCAVARLDLGAFVLGVLDEEEAARLREHVATCPRCRAEYDELAGLPTLLARLTEDEARASGVAADGVAPARLFAVAAERFGRGRRLRGVLVAATAALVLLAGTIGWALGDSGEGAQVRAAPPVVTSAPTGPPPPSASSTAPGGRTVRASDPTSGTGAQVRYAASAWGSDVDVTLSGIAPGTRCQLDVYGTRGRMETASSWVVPDTGYGAGGGAIRGTTSIPVGEITRFAIKTVGDGEELLEIPPAQP